LDLAVPHSVSRQSLTGVWDGGARLKRLKRREKLLYPYPRARSLAPHPNAAKVFINWLLSREGQEVFSRAMGQPTRRLEVDTAWTKQFGNIAAKDVLTPKRFFELENQV